MAARKRRLFSDIAGAVGIRMGSGGRSLCPYDTIRTNGHKTRDSGSAGLRVAPLGAIGAMGADGLRRRADRGFHRTSPAAASPLAVAAATARAGTEIASL